MPPDPARASASPVRHCGVRRHGSANSANPVGYTVSSARAVALGTQPVGAECRSTSRRSMDSDPAACGTGKGDTGRVRPPKPMRQPCCTSSQGAPVMLRRRAVRSLVQHAARVQSGRWVIATPWGAADCPRRPPSFDARSPRLTPQHCSAPRRLGMQLSQVCGGGVCRHVLPASAACGGYDCFRR